jgi:cytochrome o ubiquinol oxidase operon protein cyoD
MTPPLHMTQKRNALPQAAFGAYVLGFFLSIALTLGSFWVAPHLGMLAAPMIVTGAILQLFVQLFFFLHLGHRDYPRSNLLVFIFTAIIIGILIIGTLWIMSNLAHLHMHSPTTTDIYKGGVVAPQNELH